jgi:hypothetical protein
MRLIAFVLASMIASAPAMAQSWKEYTYPSYSFAVSFPSEPAAETTTYQAGWFLGGGPRLFRGAAERDPENDDH